MKTSRIAKLAASTFAAALASLVVATPAQAQRAPSPGEDADTGTVLIVPAPVESGWDVGQVAVGVAGGAVLAGAAVAVANVRRRHGYIAHA